MEVRALARRKEHADAEAEAREREVHFAARADRSELGARLPIAGRRAGRRGRG